MLVPVLIALESLAVGETCPAAVDVDARVRTILHLSPEQQLIESFLVERHEAGLYVVLRGADSTVIGERTLPLEGSCDELAQAAAVVLSAWLTDVHPDFAGALPPRVEAETPVEPPPEAKPEPQPETRPKPQLAARPAPRPARNRFEAALGLGSDLTSGVLAPAAFAGAGYGAEARGFGVSALAILTTAREEPLDPGQVRWWRWPLGVGPSLRLSTSGLSGELSAGPIAAWLHLEGSAFDRNSTQDVLVWGGFVSARISGRSRPFAPFGLVNLQFYPADATAYVTNLDQDWPLPGLSLVVTLGARLSH